MHCVTVRDDKVHQNCFQSCSHRWHRFQQLSQSMKLENQRIILHKLKLSAKIHLSNVLITWRDEMKTASILPTKTDKLRRTRVHLACLSQNYMCLVLLQFTGLYTGKKTELFLLNFISEKIFSLPWKLDILQIYPIASFA